MSNSPQNTKNMNKAMNSIIIKLLSTSDKEKNPKSTQRKKTAVFF